jgi:hypothetical protein
MLTDLSGGTNRAFADLFSHVSRPLSRSPRSQRPCQFEQLESRQLFAQMVADFALLDVNPNSTTHNETVSPRDFVGAVSGWYFGQAT